MFLESFFDDFNNAEYMCCWWMHYSNTTKNPDISFSDFRWFMRLQRNGWSSWLIHEGILQDGLWSSIIKSKYTCMFIGHFLCFSFRKTSLFFHFACVTVRVGCYDCAWGNQMQYQIVRHQHGMNYSRNSGPWNAGQKNSFHIKGTSFIDCDHYTLLERQQQHNTSLKSVNVNL